MVERPGVIDEDVEAAELLDDLVDHGLDLFTVRDVHLQRHGAAAHLAYVARGLLGEDRLLRRHQLRKRALRGLRGLRQFRIALNQDVRDHHVSAGAGQRQAVGAAQPPGPARHQGNLPRQVDHG